MFFGNKTKPRRSSEAKSHEVLFLRILLQSFIFLNNVIHITEFSLLLIYLCIDNKKLLNNNFKNKGIKNNK